MFGTSEVPFDQHPLLEVKLPVIIPEAFEMVLHYIYTDRIDCSYCPIWNRDCQIKIDILLPVKDPFSNKIVVSMMDVYQLAVEFLIPRLEQLCVQYLEFKISKDNVLDALFNSDKMR